MAVNFHFAFLEVKLAELRRPKMPAHRRIERHRGTPKLDGATTRGIDRCGAPYRIAGRDSEHDEGGPESHGLPPCAVPGSFPLRTDGKSKYTGNPPPSE